MVLIIYLEKYVHGAWQDLVFRVFRFLIGFLGQIFFGQRSKRTPPEIISESDLVVQHRVVDYLLLATCIYL